MIIERKSKDGNSFLKKMRLLLALYLNFSWVLMSCNNDLVMDASMKSEDALSQQKLDVDKFNLSANDAMNVARIYLGYSTRGDGNKVKDVKILYDGEQTPLIYIVNLDEGYMLISAERSYYPILAKIDHGKFDPESITNSSSIVFKDLIESVKLAREVNDKVSFAGFWSKYLDADIDKTYFQTRSEYDDYQRALEELYNQYDSNNNVTIRLLKRCGNVLPEDVYNRFVYLASEDDFWSGTSYEWGSTAYVVEEVIDRSSQNGPLLTTQWSQKTDFYANPYQKLGCVTVAVGQLMKFYRQPDYFDWSNMPDKYGNETVRQFLATLRTQLDVTPEGASSIDDAKRVLNSYGYNVDKINHDANRIYSSVKQSKPVYARGIDEISGTGHAWVVDGINNSQIETRYTLYRLSDIHYPDFKYVSVDDGDYNNWSSVITFHMNFGLGGKNDGWYIDQRPWIVENGSYKYKFSRDRKELIFK